MRLQATVRSVTLIILSSVSISVAEELLVRVPMEVRHNLPYVQVMVNGKGPFTFGIDTGAGGDAVLSHDLVGKLGIQSTGETEIGDPTRKNGIKVPTMKVESLKLGEVEFKNLDATEYPGPMHDAIDGILGFVLFRDYLLTLDYPHQQLRLAPGKLPPADGKEIVSFTMPDNVPVIQLHLGSQTVDAHVDSRGRELSLPETVASALKFVSEPRVIGRGRTVSNQFEIKGGQLDSDIAVGEYVFPKPFVAINPVFPIANFGSSVLQSFEVTFDQKNKLVRFVADSKTVTLAPPPAMAAAPPIPK